MTKEMQAVLKTIEELEQEKNFFITQINRGKTMFANWDMVQEVEKDIDYLKDTFIILKRNIA